MFEWWCPIIILHPTRVSDQCSHWKSKQMHKLVYFIIKRVLYVTHFVVTLYLFWCCLHCKQQPQCKHRWAIRLFDFVEWNGERGTIQPNQWQVFFKLGMMMLLRLLRVMVLSKTDFYIDKIIEPFLGRDNNSSSCSYQGTNLLNSLQKKQPYILLRKDQKIACWFNFIFRNAIAPPKLAYHAGFCSGSYPPLFFSKLTCSARNNHTNWQAQQN